jgi:hypothetical protein
MVLTRFRTSNKGEHRAQGTRQAGEDQQAEAVDEGEAEEEEGEAAEGEVDPS